ncbi:hypothetical protein IWQ56_000236 [Coemansia nantahalensis]|nr:hypothetical protein IWQ56_000236 [Coemansia nantahalensis]
MLRTTATRAVRTAAAAHLARAQTAAPRHIAQRFASTDNHHHHDGHHDAHGEEQPVFDEEDFSSPVWKYALGSIGVIYLMGKYNDYIEESGRVHPLTLFYASIMTDKEANKRIFSAYQKDVARLAEYTMLKGESHRETARALDDAVYYKRTARWGHPVGTEVDMSHAKHRMPVRD